MPRATRSPGAAITTLYRIRNALRASTDKLSAKHVARIDAGLSDGDPTMR
ncbi:MAG: hypothetical protein LH630_00075 [Actinomycetia bacterium]|nr:hypothetical protein [Actinomycetes bacterium]